jgi:aldehyde dehydrogenase (NAD+)
MEMVLDAKEDHKIDISNIAHRQRQFFQSGRTLPVRFRLEQLSRLHDLLAKYEQPIIEAVEEDFGKSSFETFGFEITIVRDEIKYLSRRLPRLVRPKKVKTPLHGFPSRNFIHHQPYGVSLIIGAWNYPVLLLLLPLVGSIAAGNCAILKPSEISGHTAALFGSIIAEAFDPAYVSVVEGGPDVTQALLKEELDHIFFTGSPRVGRIIMEAAAKQLTPVTLELGGKSPCIVEKDANIRTATKRIAWGKLVNSGQTCVAPDYLYVHEDIKEEVIRGLINRIEEFYGKNPISSEDYARIINDRHFDRITALIDEQKVVYGGHSDRESRKIAPTILDHVSWDDAVMQEEIFGPVLPVLTYRNLEDVLDVLKTKDKPLALYLFSNNRKTQKKVITQAQFGGGCINDAVIQYGLSEVPVGGIGESGIGRYHGLESFYTFSHAKGIMKKAIWPDFWFRYPPYRGKLSWLKLAFKF